LAILRTHQFSFDQITAKDKSVKSNRLEESGASVPKVKVASLMQPAQANSFQQAEMTFDVNSFNF
jgi:hypothetical protein